MGLQIIYTYTYIYINIWVNYNDLTATSLEVMVNKGNHPQMALINPLNYIRSRVPRPPGLRGPGARVLPRAL
jgi:hypothetical protein